MNQSLCVLLVAVAFLSLACCENKQTLLDAYAKQAAVNRTTATGGLIAAFKAGQISQDDAVTLAIDKLQAGEDASAFGGAVLDMLSAVEGQLAQGAEFEIFWQRVGRLAFWAANTAYTNSRKDEALALVLAGPKRWQNEAYFLRYPDHDALVAILLAEAGRRQEAITRLRDRSDLSGPAEEVYRKLTGGQ